MGVVRGEYLVVGLKFVNRDWVRAKVGFIRPV